MPVSALAVSATGKFIASGQLGSKATKTAESPVILWDAEKRSPVNMYRGLKDGVSLLAFSPDERFLAAASTSPSNQLIIWNTKDFSVVHQRVAEQATQLLTWCANASANQYVFASTVGAGQIVLNTLEYNEQTRQAGVRQANFQLPSTGLVRQYTRAAVYGVNLFVGTASGEVCVFNTATRVFKAAIPISNNGVTSIAIVQDQLFVGSGDGRIKKLSGQDTTWAAQAEVQVEGQVQALAVSPDGRELLAATTASKLYRVLAATLQAAVHAEGHVGSVLGVALPRAAQAQQFFATIDDQGYIYVHDIPRLAVATRCTSGVMQRPRGLCVCFADDGQVVGGFEDGFVRSFEVTPGAPFSQQKWEVVNAHKNGVTSVYVDQIVILTGGRDGIVRVWARQTRQLVTQISSHQKDVVTVFPDARVPHQIHSASIDKIVYTHDLKVDKKVIFRQAKNGQITHLAQRPDTFDLVTCGQNTPISFWNNSSDKPVGEFAYAEQVNCIEVSPSGRFVALGTASGELVVLQFPQLQTIGKFGAHSAGVSKLKWLANESKILSGSYDGSVCIWNFYAQ